MAKITLKENQRILLKISGNVVSATVNYDYGSAFTAVIDGEIVPKLFGKLSYVGDLFEVKQ